LYDLTKIDEPLIASLLYPNFEEDLHTVYCGRKSKKKREFDQKKAKQILESVFGKIEPDKSLEFIKKDYDRIRKTLKMVFNVKEFPELYARLKKWLEERIISR
jgi:hypothetical protein